MDERQTKVLRDVRMNSHAGTTPQILAEYKHLLCCHGDFNKHKS